MKNIIYIVIILLLSSQSSFSQEPLTEVQKLESTAKIWGFLKYYHPQVGKGIFDWDKQLIALLPKVDTAKNKEDLSQVYLNWIHSLGIIEDCISCSEKNNDSTFNENFDLSWTQNPLFTTDLSNKLKQIEENRFQGKHHYLSAHLTGTIKINDKPTDKNLDYPTANYRLLGLFQYWNRVEYFFPYKYQTDQNWNEVLTEMIPKFNYAKDTTAYHLAMLELVSKIDDSHASITTHYTNKYFGYKWIPAIFKPFDDKVILIGFYNESMAKNDDLRLGDVITKVDGKTIATILDEQSKYISASNGPTKLRKSFHAIFNGQTDSLQITFERNGLEETKTIRRYSFKEFNYEKRPASTEKWTILNDNIGYVNMGILDRKNVSRMMKEIMPCKAIIFDIRNYPKGTMYKIANYLNAEQKAFAKFIRPDLSYPGKFKWEDHTMTCGKKNKNHYKGKIILLINEQTQSHAEFTCMALQTADDVTIIGSQTAGADGNVTFFNFLGGYKTVFTGLGVFYPDGSITQRIGIVPDIVVLPTIEGIINGKDEVLEKAIEVINK